MSDVRLIDANDVVTIQVFDEMTEEYFMQTMTIAEMIDRWADEGCPPTIDAAPVVHGRWDWGQAGWCCTACGKRSLVEAVAFAKYCPRCGAKMDGGASDG